MATDPQASLRTSPCTNCKVSSLPSSIPGAASCCSRATRCVTSPTTVAGCCGSLGLLPTMTGPVCTPRHTSNVISILRSGVLVGLLQTALQGEPGEHRTPGVILQGHRDTKQHQKAVVAYGLESAMIRLDLVFD